MNLQDQITQKMHDLDSDLKLREDLWDRKDFKGDAGGRARILVVLVARESEHDVSREANSLKRVGVKIIAIGMGGSYDQFDLSSMANSLSYILTIGKVSDINSLQGSLSTLILQGNCFSSFPLLFLLLFLFFLFLFVCFLTFFTLKSI